MDKNKFLENFVEQFEETDVNCITFDTNFKELDEWSSLMALSVIAMVDEEYEVRIKGDDIRNASSVNDLFNIVASRK